LNQADKKMKGTPGQSLNSSPLNHLEPTRNVITYDLAACQYFTSNHLGCDFRV